MIESLLMNRLVSCISLLLSVSLGVLPAAAVTPAASASLPATSSLALTPPDVAPVRQQVRLDGMMRYPGPVRLERIQSESTIPLPISRRFELNAATLKLRATHSAALLKDRSRLSVILNDHVLAQIPLDGAQPTLAQDIALPVEYLEPDFNRLTFRVIQHYAASGSEDPFAPELWTQIDSARSQVVLEGAYRPLSPRLADIEELFSPKDHGDRQIAMISASPNLLDEAALRTGLLLSQALALRLRYVAPAFVAVKPIPRAFEDNPNGLDPTTFKGSDAVLFGTREQLTRFLPTSTTSRITGPFLGIYPQEGRPEKVLLVVSGRDEEEVQQAATVLCFANFPYPAAAEAVVQRLELPEWTEETGFKLMPGQTQSLKDLGFQTRTISGFHREEAEISFVLPPDLHVSNDDVALLSLHYAHGAGIEPGSSITVLVNREFATEVLISQNRATIVDSEVHAIPLRLFRPGPNTLTFVPRFAPAASTAAVTTPVDGLLMTLYNDSTLKLPKLRRFVELPNLSLLAHAAYPYAQKPDGSETRLWVTSEDSETLSAAYNLAGKLAQTTGMPLFRLLASYDVKTPSEDLMVVATRDSLPTEFTQAIGRLPQHPENPLRDWLRDLHPIAQRFIPERPDTTLDLTGMLGSRLLIAQFESPYQRGRLVSLWTADNPRALQAGMRTLVAPGAWTELNGAWTVWDPVNKKHVWRPAQRTFDRGQLTPPVGSQPTGRTLSASLRGHRHRTGYAARGGARALDPAHLQKGSHR